jgi:hypothetical protein
MQNSKSLALVLLILLGLILLPAQSVWAGPHLQTVPTAVIATPEPPSQPVSSPTLPPIPVSETKTPALTLIATIHTLESEPSPTSSPTSIPAWTATSQNNLPEATAGEPAPAVEQGNISNQTESNLAGVTWFEVVLGFVVIGFILWTIRRKNTS